ncbi:MAG: hypothetical protein JO042_08115 [Sinobacteraceae bacterium]|nr:hypothetical protein [Nevskiaceae bacterium]
MRRWIPPTLLLLLSLNRLWAAEVAPLLDNQRAGVAVRQLAFPDTLDRDLKSGLTSRLLLRVILLAESQPLARQTAEVTMKYDLWDETFAVTMKVGDTIALRQTLSSLADVRARLEDLRLPNLFAMGGVDTTKPLVIQVDVLLNPIEKERMEEIRKWVAENTTHTAPVDPDRPASTAPLADSNDVLFNRIFEQYAAGAEVASGWHQSLQSKPFTLKELTHVGP